MDTQTAAQTLLDALATEIAQIDNQIGPLLEKRKSKAFAANTTAAAFGLPVPYPDLDASSTTPQSCATEVIAPDHYTGKKMATACREIMQRRKARGLGAIQLEELYSQLKSGGYPFRAAGKENAVTSLATTLGKNTQFRRVPGSTSLWGLSEWYGGPARRKTASAAAEEDESEEEGSDDSESPNDSPAATPQSA